MGEIQYEHHSPGWWARYNTNIIRLADGRDTVRTSFASLMGEIQYEHHSPRWWARYNTNIIRLADGRDTIRTSFASLMGEIRYEHHSDIGCSVVFYNDDARTIILVPFSGSIMSTYYYILYSVQHGTRCTQRRGELVRHIEHFLNKLHYWLCMYMVKHTQERLVWHDT